MKITPDDIKKAIRTLQKAGKEPKAIRMSPETYSDLYEEIHRYLVPGIRDDDPYTIILDSDGSQIPMGTIYGLEIYVDKRLPPDITCME